MSIEALKENLQQFKKIIREIYAFTSQLETIKNLETGSRVVINTTEKKLLNEAIVSLTAQLRILNNSIPMLIKNIGFYQKIPEESLKEKEVKTKLIQIKYKPEELKEKVSMTVSERDRKEFLNNLSKSNLSINQLKKKYAVEKQAAYFGKPSAYAKLSNHFFKNLANHFVAKGYFKQLNKALRKMNSPFVLGTYVSMIIFTVFISLILSIFLYLLLLFFNLSLVFPFIIPTEESISLRAFKSLWVFLIPIVAGVLMYFYPSSEAKNLGSKIDQELPFVSIHMSAIATSGVEPISIFKIILRSEEYRYTNTEFRKLMNLINFHGQDLVSALKMISRTSPSAKLKELFDGMAITITSGGELHNFLDKHSESLLFDFKLEREKYTKTSETFMDIYISVVIAAPMIFLMLFVIMGSTGATETFLGLSAGVLSFLIILAITLLNLGFLLFLRMKQPAI